MLVQRPQDNEALRGIDGYEQMVNTFAKNAKAYWRLWGPRRGDLGGAAMLVPAVAAAKSWRGQSFLAFRLLQVIGPGHPLRGAPAPYCERVSPLRRLPSRSPSTFYTVSDSALAETHRRASMSLALGPRLRHF
jgi:hypothetical protein